MTRLKRTAIWLTAIAAMVGADLGAEIGIPGVNMITEAQARVGRPLTPMSYAGVARRTSRRVARRTIYRITVLPAGCLYGPYYGGSYYRCGSLYYRAVRQRLRPNRLRLRQPQGRQFSSPHF